MKTLEDFVPKESVPAQPLDVEEAETKPVVKAGEGFVIKEIEMKGFMRYIERTSPPITFPNKFTVITGKTGSGKTSILDAIMFALYGRTSRTDIKIVKTSDICKPGGYVRVAFSQNNEEYEVERGFNSRSSPYLNLKRNGKDIEGNIRERGKTIEDVIGLDYDGFRNSTFVRQEEMKALGTHKGADRLEIFQKLFRLETFGRAQKLADKRHSVIIRQADAKEAELKVERRHAEKLPSLQTRMKELGEEMKEGERALEKLKNELKRKKEVLERLEKEHENYVRIQTKLKDIRKVLEGIERNMKEAEKQMSEFRGWEEKAKELEKEAKNHDKLREESDGLKELQNKSQRVKDRLQMLQEQEIGQRKEFEREMRELSSGLKAQEARISDLTTAIDKNEAFGLLREEGRLEERITRIEKELNWLSEREELLRELRREEKRAKTALTGVSKKVSEVNADSFVLSEIKSNIEGIKKKMEATKKNNEEKAEKIKGKMEELGDQLKKLGFGEKEGKRLSFLKKHLSETKKKTEKLKEIRGKMEEIGDLSKYMEELESQRKEKTLDKEDLKKKHEKLSRTEREYLFAKKEVGKLEEEEKNLSGVIGQIEGKISQIKAQIAELEAVLKNIQAVEQELEELRERAEIYDLLKNQILHKRGIVMYAIDQLLPQLSLETSENLSDMTDGRFSKVRLNSYEENNSYGIRIDVSGVDGEWHDVQEFSGGEKTQINAALRFAIAKELASMPQVGRTYGRMKTLFIDEGDLGSLDTESSRRLFVKKLFDMGRFFEKIILITHLSEVAEQFPERMVVYMTPEQESKIEVVS